jgi:hypothetical protein
MHTKADVDRSLFHFIGAADTIDGILLVLRIIFMPQGVVGALQGLKPKRAPRAAGKPVPARP